MNTLLTKAGRMLITGGAGFIGVNTARFFSKSGWEITILDNFSRKGTDINVRHLLVDCPDVVVVRADVRSDLAILQNLVDSVDVVVHLAAQVAVTTSILDPRMDFETNVLGTFNVLEAIRQSASRPFLINASTNKVFGALESCEVREAGDRYEFVDDGLREWGISESHPLDFHSPYGCSKGAADQYVLDYARIYGLKTVTFRQSCIYGTNQFGVEDQGWLAWFAIAIMLDKPLTLYGNGRQVRDALYVDDLMRLYAYAIEHQNAISGRAYVVGGGPGNTTSLIELLRLLETTLGKSPVLSYADIRQGDQPIFVADIRLLYSDVAWRPEHTIEGGVTQMVGWMRAHEHDIRTLFLEHV